MSNNVLTFSKSVFLVVRKCSWQSCPRCDAAFTVADRKIHQIIALTPSISSPWRRLHFCRAHENTFCRWSTLEISKLWWDNLCQCSWSFPPRVSPYWWSWLHPNPTFKKPILFFHSAFSQRVFPFLHSPNSDFMLLSVTKRDELEPSAVGDRLAVSSTLNSSMVSIAPPHVPLLQISLPASASSKRFSNCYLDWKLMQENIGKLRMLNKRRRWFHSSRVSIYLIWIFGLIIDSVKAASQARLFRFGTRVSSSDLGPQWSSWSLLHFLQICTTELRIEKVLRLWHCDPH